MNCYCGVSVKFYIGRDGKPGYRCPYSRCRFFANGPVQCDGYYRVVATNSTPADAVIVRLEALLHPESKELCVMACCESNRMAMASTSAGYAHTGSNSCSSSSAANICPAAGTSAALREDVRRVLENSDIFEAAWYVTRQAYVYPMKHYARLCAALQALPSVLVEPIPNFFFRALEHTRPRVRVVTCGGERVRSASSGESEYDAWCSSSSAAFGGGLGAAAVHSGVHDGAMRECGPGGDGYAPPVGQDLASTFLSSPVYTQMDAEDYVWSQLRPFQRAGVHFLVARAGRGMIADDMGLGKTIQAIAVAHHYRREWPVLVVCPMSLMDNWAKEFNKFCSIPFSRITILQSSGTGGSGSKAHTQGGIHDVVIVSYSSLRCVESMSVHFAVMVLDESHYIKAGETKRTQQALKLCRQARRVVLLSGTPVVSRPMELYTQMQAIQPAGLPSRLQFGARYCNSFYSRFGVDVTGHSHADELHCILKNLIIRRTKKELGAELPSKTRQLLYVYITDKERKALEKRVLELRRVMTAAHSSNSNKSSEHTSGSMCMNMGSGGGNNNSSSNISLTACGSLSSTHRVALSSGEDLASRAPNAFELKAATARAKIAAVQDYITGMVGQHLEAREKVILFAHHQIMMTALRTAVESVRPHQPLDYIFITGDTPVAQREQLMEHFRSCDSCAVAILSMQSSGTGHNLTCASTVVFAELDWNPSTHLQCEDRVHRIGQSDPCTIKYLLAEGTSDSVIWPLLQSKLTVTTAVLESSATLNSSGQRLKESEAQKVRRRDAGEGDAMRMAEEKGDRESTRHGECGNSVGGERGSMCRSQQSKLDDFVRRDSHVLLDEECSTEARLQETRETTSKGSGASHDVIDITDDATDETSVPPQAATAQLVLAPEKAESVQVHEAEESDSGKVDARPAVTVAARDVNATNKQADAAQDVPGRDAAAACTSSVRREIVSIAEKHALEKGKGNAPLRLSLHAVPMQNANKSSSSSSSSHRGHSDSTNDTCVTRSTDAGGANPRATVLDLLRRSSSASRSSGGVTDTSPPTKSSTNTGTTSIVCVGAKSDEEASDGMDVDGGTSSEHANHRCHQHHPPRHDQMHCSSSSVGVPLARHDAASKAGAARMAACTNDPCVSSALLSHSSTTIQTVPGDKSNTSNSSASTARSHRTTFKLTPLTEDVVRTQSECGQETSHGAAAAAAAATTRADTSIEPISLASSRGNLMGKSNSCFSALPSSHRLMSTASIPLSSAPVQPKSARTEISHCVSSPAFTIHAVDTISVASAAGVVGPLALPASTSSDAETFVGEHLSKRARVEAVYAHRQQQQHKQATVFDELSVSSRMCATAAPASSSSIDDTGSSVPRVGSAVVPMVSNPSVAELSHTRMSGECKTRTRFILPVNALVTRSST